MFCRYCGKEISDDSKFCNYCGKNLQTDSSQTKVEEKNENTINDNEISTNSGCGKSIGISLLIILLSIAIVFVVIKIASNSDSNGNIVDKIVERDITKSDYSMTSKEGLTSYTITIVPNVKMNTCSVELKLLDSKGNVIYADTITKSDLKKGSSYSYTFEFGFINTLSGSKVSYKVTGKCVD